MPASNIPNRLVMARMVGSLRALEVDTRKFTAARAMRAINLAVEGQIPDARAALNDLQQFEGLDPVFEDLRNKFQ